MQVILFDALHCMLAAHFCLWSGRIHASVLAEYDPCSCPREEWVADDEINMQNMSIFGVLAAPFRLPFLSKSEAFIPPFPPPPLTPRGQFCIAGTPGRLQCAARNFWSSEISDTQGVWQYESPAFGTYMVTPHTPLSPMRVREFRLLCSSPSVPHLCLHLGLYRFGLQLQPVGHARVHVQGTAAGEAASGHPRGQRGIRLRLEEGTVCLGLL